MPDLHAVAKEATMKRMMILLDIEIEELEPKIAPNGADAGFLD